MPLMVLIPVAWVATYNNNVHKRCLPPEQQSYENDAKHAMPLANRWSWVWCLTAILLHQVGSLKISLLFLYR